MVTIQRAANAQAAVGTGWTNPTNAYADDGTLASFTGANGTTWTTDYGFANVTTSDIPDGSTITAVRMVANVWQSSATRGSVGVQGRNNGANSGTEATGTSTSTTALVTATLSGVTLSDLRSASTLLKARVRATRTASQAFTASLDYVYLEVDYTPPPPTLSVASWRFREDDGDEASATWKAAANTNVALSARTDPFRLRFEVQETGGGSGAHTLTLQYSIDGGGWGDFDDGTIFCPASALTNGGATTNQLSAGTGTFVAGEQVEAPATTAAFTTTHAANGHTEYEIALQLDAGAWSTVDFRLRYSTGSAIGSTPANARVTFSGTVQHALTGSASGTGSATGSATIRADLSGSAAGAGSATGSATIRAALSGSATGSATASGDLTVAPAGVTHALTGTATGSGSASGSIALRAALSGTAPGTGSATGSATIRANLTGSASGTGAGSATLTARMALSGSGTGSGAATGALTYRAALTGSAAGSGALAAAPLTLRLSLSGSGTGTASASLSGQTTHDLTGSGTGTAGASGALSLTRPLTGSAAGSATMTGSTVSTPGLSGSATGAGSAIGSLVLRAGLTGAATGTGAGTGDLTVQAPFVPLGLSVRAKVTQATLSATVRPRRTAIRQGVLVAEVEEQ